ELQQDEAMQKIKATHERFNVLRNTNQEFELQEIQGIMQGSNVGKVQQHTAQVMHQMMEETQPSTDIVQQRNDEVMQQKIQEEKQQDILLQQNIQNEMKQEKRVAAET
ncbi:hypothetical protein PIB30_114870, partial [Stylosanthes scabra]|nr:hypothetical protein [Stylosanthes scabra]